MSKPQHPITPPQELLEQWRKEAPSYCFKTAISREEWIATRAAQWGADQELDACEQLLKQKHVLAWSLLRPHRRPKPPSLKEQALETLDEVSSWPMTPNQKTFFARKADIIRRALESIKEDQ